MPLLEFSHKKTMFHRVSPMVKLGWGALVMLWLFMIPDPVHMFLFGLVIFVQGVVGARISPVKFLKATLIIGVASIFIVIFQGLLYPGKTVLIDLGPLHPTLEGISFGLVIALRVLAIVGASLTIARTTDPHDIFLTMVQAGLPYKIAYGMFIALRFIPLMEYEAATIQSAQFVRGITQQKGGGIANRIKQISNFLVPFIAVGIRRADQSALAMEVRAFGLYPTRTNLRELDFPKVGRLFLIVWIAAFVLYVTFFNADVLGAINFSPNQ